MQSIVTIVNHSITGENMNIYLILYVVSFLFFLISCTPNKIGKIDYKEKINEGANKTQTTNSRLCRTFPMRGVTTVVLRADKAYNVRVERNTSEVAKICGNALASPMSFHSKGMHYSLNFDMDAPYLGMNFQGKRYGNTFIIAAYGELSAAHHVHIFVNLEIFLPKQVKLKSERLNLELR